MRKVTLWRDNFLKNTLLPLVMWTVAVVGRRVTFRAYRGAEIIVHPQQ